MRRHVPVVAFAFAVLVAGPAAFWQDDSPPEMEAMSARLLAEWPKRIVSPLSNSAMDDLRASDAPEALPSPSLTEPFEIGEALNDPGRVEDAVVSMLARMNIGIVPRGTPMQRVSGRERLKITEAEARALISMTQADAEAAASDPDGGPFTFKDLYSALSPLMPRLSIEQMAERYAKAYESHPDWLVPQLLQGRPIEPEAPLLRVHLWLLLADGVTRPAARAALERPRLVLASTRGAQAGSVGWGNGILEPDWRAMLTPEHQLSGAEWQEVIMRMPLFMSELVTLTPAQPRTHEKHGGSGSRVQIEARLSATPPAMVSSTTGRIILGPRRASIANMAISWRYAANLRSHGSMDVPEGVPVQVGTDGMARITYDPKDEVANGRGQLMRDEGAVEALMRPDELVVPLYNLPPAAKEFVWGEVSVGSVVIRVEWHAEDTLEIFLKNTYHARILGALQRDGIDFAIGTLEKANDGTYRGVMALVATPFRTVLPGKNNLKDNCRHRIIAGAQLADVIATPITETDSRGQREGAFYNFVHSNPKFFAWDSGQPEDYLRLEFFPTIAPQYYLAGPKLEIDFSAANRTGRPACEDEIGGPVGPNGRTPNFVPLNAAQWTVEHTGYAIAIPAEGEELAYRDRTSSRAFMKSGGIAGAIEKLAAGSDSVWHVSVRRLKKP